MSQQQVSAGQPGLDVSALNVDINHLFLGLYGWEYVQSLDVEYALIRRRLSFRLSLLEGHLAKVPYLVARTCLLIFLILITIDTSPLFKGKVHCLPSISLVSLSGDIALGCSSMIFMIRTWVIWKDSRLVHILLSLLSLVQWSVLIIDVATVRARSIDGTCEVYFSYPQISAVAFIYTTCFDFLVLVLLIVGLSGQRSESPLRKRLLSQGILYFVVAVMGYIPSTVVFLLNRTSLIILFCNCSIVVSTIASCRAVRSLLFLDTCKQSRTPESGTTLTTQIAV